MDNSIILEMLKKQEHTLQQIKKEISNSQTPTSEIDLEQVSKLSEQLQMSISKVDEVVEATRKPVISERKFTVDILSKGAMGLMVGMLTAITLRAVTTHHALEPNYSQRDNDLKYRYIKMKGEATPATISELETIFEQERDNAKIHKMLKTVEEYEKTIRKKVIAEEQARLKQQELEQLNQETMELKER